MKNAIIFKVYPFGLNLFFQPGLGPGFFLTLDSSGAFGLRLLFRIAPFRALAEKFKGITAGLLTSAIFLSDGYWNPPLVWIRLKQFIVWHPVFSNLLQLIFRDAPRCTRRVITVDVIQNLLNTYVTDVSQINRQKETNLSDRSLSATLSSSWAGGENASSGPEKSGVGWKPQVHQPSLVQTQQ